MSNHLYIIVRAKNENLSDIIRDFKKYTSKSIYNKIIKNEKESRKDWLLKVPANETIRKSVAGPQNWTGNIQKGGFTQYQIIGYAKNTPPIIWFSNTIDITTIIK